MNNFDNVESTDFLKPPSYVRALESRVNKNTHILTCEQVTELVSQELDKIEVERSNIISQIKESEIMDLLINDIGILIGYIFR